MKLAVFGWLRRRPGRKPPRSKRLKRIRNTITLLMLSLVIGLLLFLNSNSFQDRVRQRVIAELELVTGGKVEIQSFTWSLSRLQFEIGGLTIHGLMFPWKLFHIENGENTVGEWLSETYHSDFSRLFPSYIRFNYAGIVGAIAIGAAITIERVRSRSVVRLFLLGRSGVSEGASSRAR